MLQRRGDKWSNYKEGGVSRINVVYFASFKKKKETANFTLYIKTHQHTDDILFTLYLDRDRISFLGKNAAPQQG